MKVGMYYSNQDVRVEEYPMPQAGPNEVVIKVEASGICGSDLLEWYRIKRAPLVLGHELTGTVIQAGPGIKQWQQGDRVFAIHHVPCENCPECFRGHGTACREFHGINNFEPGGFSQFLKIRGRSVETGMLKLADNISFEQGTFIEPLGTALRGQRSCNVSPGDSVLVIGSGLSGLLHIKTARALGAGKIMAVDIQKQRLDAALSCGADNVFFASDDIMQNIKETNNGRLADKVILCIGVLEAAGQALECVEKGGTVLFFAVPMPGEKVNIDFNPFWRNDITIKTSYGSAPQDHFLALELLSKRRIVVDDMITHRFPLEDIQKAFSKAARGDDCLKVIIKP